MKKKVLFMVTALLVAFTASAQLSVKGGLGISNLLGEDVEGYSAKLGFYAGLGYDYEFAHGVALQTGLYGVSKGAKHDGKSVSGIYLQVPVHIAAKIDFTPGTRIVIHGGPFVAYGIAGKNNLWGSSKKTFGEGGAKPFDAGFGMGAGTELGRFLLDFGVDMGLLQPDEDHKAKNMSAYLAIGIRF